MPAKTLEEIVDIKRRHEKEWLSLPGVSGVDIGSRAGIESTGGLCIRIYVTNKARAPHEILSLRNVEGVPVEIIERSFELQ